MTVPTRHNLRKKLQSLGGRLKSSTPPKVLQILRYGRRLITNAVPVDCVRLGSFEAFEAWQQENRKELLSRQKYLRSRERAGSRSFAPALCNSCQNPARFWTPDAAGASPNWRECEICCFCSFSSRLRACVFLLREKIAPAPDARVYLTEQVTGVYSWFRRNFPNTIGSEYLRDGTATGQTNPQGIRHEDLTKLTLEDESQDLIASFEVCEHIPDYNRAFAECIRVLKPGGALLLSVPFHAGPKHLTRAELNADGSITHIEPPEYHGDPLSDAGCLCFHHFGWDILKHLKAAGFRTADAYAVWSRPYRIVASEGYQIHFVAFK